MRFFITFGLELENDEVSFGLMGFITFVFLKNLLNLLNLLTIGIEYRAC